MKNRFGFGKNWKKYIQKMDESRIQHAIQSLLKPLGMDTLNGKQFIDIGSGSGLMSLAAIKSGAKVLSFDYDLESVESTQILKSIYAVENPDWQIEQGSILDTTYVNKLGTFDIVYSWGVLHHTGDMDQAIRNAVKMVNRNGLIYLAIYNHQGIISKLWLLVKRLYNTGFLGRLLVVLLCVPYFYITGFISDLLRYRNPVSSIIHYKSNRGMSYWHDIIDWIGGYPFEFATPAEIINPMLADGFELIYLSSTTSMGCNEYIFKKKENG